MAKSLKDLCHVEKSIASLQQYPRVALNNIKDFDEAFKKQKRKGRGIGSSKGKTGGRGQKGQGKYGTMPRLGFEGGKTPFYILVPKHGFKNKFQRTYNPLNLNKLQYFIDSGRLDPSQKIDMHTLYRVGAVTRIKHGVKLLATGADWFQAKVDIEVSRASKIAIDAIEKQGGKVTCAHYNKLGLRVLLKPEKFEDRPGGPPRRAQPPKKLMNYYKDPQNRGYLADPEKLEELRKLTLVKYGLPNVDPDIEFEQITEQTKNMNVSETS